MPTVSNILKTTLIAFGLFSSTAMASSQTFYDMSPAATTIGGVRYPRSQNHLYRGTTDGQMDFKKAVSAMLGDQDANVESFFFSTIRSELMQIPFPRAMPLNNYLRQQIQKAIAQNGGALSLTKAVQETKRLVDGTYAFYDQNGTAESTYVNYRSGSFVDWPNDVVFSTFLSPLAGTYGDRILVIEEKQPRSLDLNFWNYTRNGTWYDHTRDIGEFIAFGYLPASDLAGYQVRTGSSKSWHRIQYAAYIPASKETDVLLVFEGLRDNGRDSSCIDLNSKNKTYYHCEFQPGDIISTIPDLSSEKVKLAGVISLCTSSDKNSCATLSKTEAQKYPSAAISSSKKQEIENSLKGLTINGKSVRFLPLNP